jgi:hypothetical protein
MKKISVLSAILVLFAAIGFTSCDSEPVDPVLSENINPEAFFQVEKDGELFTAISASATIINGGIALGGVNATGEAVGFVVTDVEEGTYENAMQFYTTADQVEYINANPETVEIEGSVTITEINTINHTISGTFHFKAWSEVGGEPIEFTNGVFEDVPYTGDINPTPVGDEYFKAKIDGDLTNFGVINAMPLGEQIALVGANTGESIDIRVPVGVEPGTYEISEDFENGIYAMYMSLGEMNGYGGVSGTLIITSSDETAIEGTFEFVGEDFDGNTIEITDGEFHVAL